MVQLGFLVSKVVPNPRPSKRLKMLNMMKVKYQVVFSWKELKRFSNRPYSREAFRFVKMLSQNSILIKAIEEFRRIFCLPLEGVYFVRKHRTIRNKQCGAHKPIWCYENLLPKAVRPQAQKYIADFIERHNIHAPLKYQMDSLFYCGFVDSRINDIWAPLGIHIPTQQDIEQRAWGYRIPVSICLNSANLTKKEVKKFIDEHWADIQGYFKQNPAVMDVAFSDNEELIASYKDMGLTHSEILEKRSPAVSENPTGSTEQIAEIYYRLRKKANKIITSKTP